MTLCLHLQQLRQSSKESTASSDTDSSSDDESSAQQPPPSGVPDPNSTEKQTKETEAVAEISALVNYVQPVHFNSFENSESKFGAVSYFGCYCSRLKCRLFF